MKSLIMARMKGHLKIDKWLLRVDIHISNNIGINIPIRLANIYKELIL